MMSEERRVYYEMCILSDDNAVELSNQLARATNVRHIHFRLHREANFTHEGLKAVARSMREHPELETLLVWDKCCPDEPIVEVVKVLYLEGNLQNLDEISINNEHAQFVFDCFRVGQNDIRMKEYYIPSSREWNGKNPTEFAACLHGNTQLQKLGVSIGTHFTSEDADALAAAMCNSQATNLLLNSYNTSIRTTENILRILCRDGIQASGRVWEYLKIESHFAHAGTMSPVAEVIPFVKALRICQVGEKLQTKEEMRRLFAGLERSCNLVSLALNHCRLDADDMRMLWRALRHHRSLKSLNLDWNIIMDAGVAAFVEHWDEHLILESLELFGNQIGHTGALQLMNAVANRHTMKVLKVDGNHFGYSVLQMIGEQLPNLRLKVLDLQGYTDNEVGKQSAYQSLLRGLKDNHYLHRLFLSHNLDKDEFGNELSFYVELSKHGRYLITDANAVAPTVWCTILAKCKSHIDFSRSMMYYFLREQPHLVRRAQSMVME